MDLVHLYYFCKIAEYENVTKAARELHVAQPALSRVLHALERELGVSLFYRCGRHISLNENGRILVSCAKDIFARIEAMKEELHDRGGAPWREKITIIVKVASKFLPEIISGFRQKHPDVHIVIIQNEMDDMPATDWDLKLDASREKQENENTTCLLKEKICLAMPKDHPLANQKSIRLSDVSGESFLGMQKGSSMNAIAAAYCREAGFVPNIILETDNPSTLRGLMRLGLGIAFNPVITWKEVSEEEFQLIPIADIDCCRYIHLSLNPKRYHPKVVLAFQEYLIQFFSGLPGKR